MSVADSDQVVCWEKWSTYGMSALMLLLMVCAHARLSICRQACAHHSPPLQASQADPLPTLSEGQVLPLKEVELVASKTSVSANSRAHTA
jgi:hypothetical protein